MGFFDIEKKIRINQEQQDRINELLQMDGDLQNDSHIFRCALNHFYNMKKEKIKAGKVKKLV